MISETYDKCINWPVRSDRATVIQLEALNYEIKHIFYFLSFYVKPPLPCPPPLLTASPTPRCRKEDK